MATSEAALRQAQGDTNLRDKYAYECATMQADKLKPDPHCHPELVEGQR